MSLVAPLPPASPRPPRSTWVLRVYRVALALLAVLAVGIGFSFEQTEEKSDFLLVLVGAWGLLVYARILTALFSQPRKSGRGVRVSDVVFGVILMIFLAGIMSGPLWFAYSFLLRAPPVFNR